MKQLMANARGRGPHSKSGESRWAVRPGPAADAV